jgi:hypothetical protein
MLSYPTHDRKERQFRKDQAAPARVAAVSTDYRNARRRLKEKHGREQKMLRQRQTSMDR